MTLTVRKTLTALAIALAPPAIAQDATPSLSDIVEAWLASPHADRSSEAFIHWNEDGEVPGSCAVCHSSSGVREYLETPMSTPGRIDHAVGLGTTVDCTACHGAAATRLETVVFPSGVVVQGEGPSSICTVCHQGRASAQTLLDATQGIEDDTVNKDLRFINVHYAPSASTQLGSVVHGGFEYEGKVYKDRFDHVPEFSTCTGCHSPHSLEVDLADCISCHQGASDFGDIRMSRTDFDGNGDSAEGIAAPIAALHARLGAAIQIYAETVAGVPVAYTAGSHPYYFVDSDGDGAVSATESDGQNRYQSWTPRLLKAAYNYQLIAKEPAIYAHNPQYALQLLYDSLESLSEQVDVDMAGLIRP